MEKHANWLGKKEIAFAAMDKDADVSTARRTGSQSGQSDERAS